MKRRHLSPVLRLAGRILLALAICAVVVLSSMEFAQRIGQNLALARELSHSQRDVRMLVARRDQQLREIRRLQRPEGVVPYIYRRLRMVRPGQTLIYLVPTPAAAANP